MDEFNNVVIGSIKGTGSVLRVEIGFVPRYIKAVNIEDAGTLYPIMEWMRGMAAASGIKTLKIFDNGTTANASSTYITSNGISEYQGEAPGCTLTGTVAATAGSATLIGTNTSFLTELAVGDLIKLKDGQEFTVSAISSNTSLTVTAAATASVTTGIAVRLTGKKAGFLIGADTDMNAANETIVYMAVR
jgi:hypothetical protein